MERARDLEVRDGEKGSMERSEGGRGGKKKREATFVVWPGREAGEARSTSPQHLGLTTPFRLLWSMPAFKWEPKSRIWVLAMHSFISH